jgi:uncharacterized protein (DUF849 family)
MLIKACLNGGTTRAQHHAVPQTPAELAADAAAGVRAGAGAIHLHPRDAVGAETLDPSAVLAAVDAVRAAVPGTPIGVTTGVWASGGDPDRRMALVSQWTGTVQPDFASVNWSEPGADELAELLGKLGIAVEAGIWSVADAARLADGAIGDHVLRILIEAALDGRGFTAPRLQHGEGAATWAVLRVAIKLGRDIRVGLEDTTVLPDGRLASGNAALVEAAVNLVAELSRPS